MRKMVMALALLLPGAVAAQEKALTLAADSRLEQSGLLDYLVPRFALKTGVRVHVAPGDADAVGLQVGTGAADAALLPEPLARGLDGAERVRRVILAPEAGQGGGYAILLVAGSPNREHARRFADWLASDVGQRTVASFDGPVTYEPGLREAAEEEVVLPEGDVDAGERLSILHCGRCHVVSDKNRFAGIGSTPSFPALRSIPGWEEKFLTFWDENPHPSFMQVTGVTEPFDPDRPPHIAPVEITVEEMEAIVAFAASIPPMDLGAEVQSR